MATGRIIGQIEVASGDITIIGTDGLTRAPEYGGYVYEGEQVVSNDPEALFQVKYSALPEATAYDGVFRILADGSVIAGMDAMESVSSSENLADVLETAAAEEPQEDVFDLETAAGEESADGNSAYIPTEIVAESSVQDFGRGPNPSVSTLPGVDIGADITYNLNDTPVALPDTAVVNEDGSVIIDVTANDTDFDGTIDPTTVVIATAPQNGSAVVNADGTVTYTPNADYYGPDNFSYTVKDNDGGVSNPAVVNISVNPVNDMTVVNPDSAVTDEDTPIAIDVLANDTDIDGADATLVSATDGANGTTSVNTETGVVTYTPNPDFNGVDTFTYTNSEGNSEVVTVTVNPVNDMTVVNPDSAVTDEDTPIAIDVLANDTDIDGADATLVSATDGANGTTSVNTETGVVTYTPNPDFNGVDTFTYTNSEGNSEVVTVTVNPVNDAPSIDDGTISAVEDIVYTLSTADFDGFTDIDGDSMTDIRIDSLPTNGTLYIDGVAATVGSVIAVSDLDSGVLYLTSENNADDTSFMFSASDGAAWSDSQTMTVNITPVTDTVQTDTLDVRMVVIPPVIDTSTLSMSDDINPLSNIFETTEGLVLTSPDGTLVQVNTKGNGLGIDSGSGSNDARDIEGGLTEYLQVDFPPATSLNEINIDVKHTGGDLISITLYDSNGDIIDPVAANVVFTSDVIGVLSTADGSLTSDGYINGDMLGQGGDTITINSDIAFASLKIVDENSSDSGGTDGFSVLNIYGTVSSTPDSYESIIYIDNLGLGDTDGSEEISSITFSDFPTGSVITLADGTTEITANADGNWVIDADDLDLGGGTSIDDVSMTLTSPIAISTSFEPTLDIVTTEIGAGVPDSHTILGGTSDSVLYGADGEDYIDGGAGDDIIDGLAGADAIYGGTGDDTILYDATDSTIDGGEGVDTLIISDNDTLDLSNVSNINTIQLESFASVIGTGDSSGITASDVMNATDAGSNELIIQSADGSGADNSVTIDTSTFTDISADADYNIFSDGTSTLMVDIDIPIETV